MIVQELFTEIEIYLRMVWRYRWMALSFAMIVSLIGWGVVAVLPNVYQVSATVQVERSSMLPALLKGIAVESDLAREMAGLMRQTMLVKPNLELVAHESGLDKGVDTPEKLDLLIERLGTRIDISAGSDRPNVYTVTYEHSDPAVAQRVVKTLLDRFQDTILTVTRKDLENSKRFVDQQIEQYQIKMETAEQKIREFKEKHLDILEDGRTYYGRLEDSKNQYKAALLELAEAEKEVSAIRAEAGLSTAANLARRDGQAARPIDLRIAELEKALAELRVKFTEQHPDVIIAKRALEEWRARKSGEMQEGGRTITGEGSSAWSVDPAYQARQSQLTRAEAKVAGLRSRVEEYKRRVAQLQESVSTVPRMEVELAKLNREHSFQKENYQTLVMRRESALVADRLEHAKELKLNVLEAPRDPLRPVSPKRIYLNTLVLILGIGAGVGLVLLVSQIDPVIYSRRDLVRVAALPVLGSVSWSETARGKGSLLETNRYFFLAVTILVLGYLVILTMYELQVGLLTKLAGFGSLFLGSG
jgi:polysaccharide chain length determinant protein (PEP-CTERM system associated)